MKKSLAGTAALAVAMAGAVGALGAGAAAQAPERISRPVQATQFDTSPARTYGVPGIAVDPDDPLHLVASAVDLRTQRCGTMESVDGGQNWASLDSSPSPDDYPLCLMTNSHTTMGKVAYGSDGILYYGLAGWDEEDGANRSIFLGRSDDDGESWQTTVVRDTRGREGEEQQPNRPLSGMAIDTTGAEDVIYLTWRQQSRATAPNQVPPLPIMAVSTDGGATFSEPINLTNGTFESDEARGEAFESVTTTTEAPAPVTTTTTASGPTTTEEPAEVTTTTTVPEDSPAADPDQPINFGGSNPVVTVDDEGTAYTAWVSSYANQNMMNPEPAHFLTRTSDQGETLEVFPITGHTPENTNSFGGLEMVWSPEGGNDGTLHVVYEGSRTPNVESEADVLHRTSTDRGETWSEPAVLNDDAPEALYFSGFPKIGIAPDGRLDVAWFDTRSDPGLTANDVYYTYSTDNGANWSENIRVSDQSIDRRIGVFASNFDLNGPPGIASTDDFALVAWDDTRNFDEVTQGQDIYAAAVQFEELAAGTSDTSRYVLAAVVGIVVVGLLFVVLSLVARRRQLGRVGSRRGAATAG